MTNLGFSQERKILSSDTLFDLHAFMKDVSFYLLPEQFRTEYNLNQIKLIADVYGITNQKMRNYIATTVNTGRFDTEFLRSLCAKAKLEYIKIDRSNYGVPCVTYLMTLQNGKEVTPFDKEMLYALATDYHLKPQVINVLISHTLKRLDNRLIRKYVYAVAADMYRNSIETADEAVRWLTYEKKVRSRKKQDQEDTLPVYDTSKNMVFTKEEEEELLKSIGRL